MSRRLLYRSVWIPSLAAIGGMTYLFAVMPVALPIPGTMKRYHSGDRSIAIRHPENWKVRELGAHAVTTELHIQPTRNALMIIREDLTGSLSADIMKATDAQTASIAAMIPGGDAMLKEKKSPLERLHEMDGAVRKKNKEAYPDYAEEEAVKTQVAGREALMSKCSWNEPGFFTTRPMEGRRITLLSGDHEVTVFYGCLKEMRSVVLPLFDTMVGSLEVDGQGGAK